MEVNKKSLLADNYDWMLELANFINDRNPLLNSLAEVYMNEANYGRRFIDNDLKLLPNNAQILEVGAGSLLLSTQLVREGFDITALEPVGVGFSHFNQLQLLVSEFAEMHGIKPKLLSSYAEDLTETLKYDFAFSINVMEHVGNVQICIKKVTDALKKDAYYRFICPNYSFPYEPHFDIPTLFNKKFTEVVFKNSIYNNQNVPDPKGVWESLNWISIGVIRKAINSIPGLNVSFDKKVLGDALRRVAYDSEFSSRRSTLIVRLCQLLTFLRLINLTKFIPLMIQPVIDCTITKK